MQYLPIYPEKNWDQTVLGYDYWGPAGESLPVTNTFLNASRGFSAEARRANDPITWLTDVTYGLGNLGGAVLVGPITDTVGNVGNLAYNGYKRLYNYGANAYNNLADRYNNWAMRRANPQTSLTGRKITPDMNPALYNLKFDVAEKPDVYLYDPDTKTITAKLIHEYPYETVVTPAMSDYDRFSAYTQTAASTNPGIQQAYNNWLTDAKITQENIRYNEAMAAQRAAENANLKRTIARGLASMVSNGKLTGDTSRTQKLINLYNKIK